MKILSFIILLLVLVEFPVLAGVSTNDLIDRGKEYDRKEVSFEGEVIREPMVRGSHTWLNISDGNNTIGVWFDSRLISGIKKYGSYHVKGDTVQVGGVFYRSCPEHGGDMDIHAKSLALVEQGYETSRNVKTSRIIAAFLFAVTAFGAYYYEKLQKNQLTENSVNRQ